jgi:CRP/FNR family transcriptional regulator, cyclic AMP receptor protein
MAWPVTLEADKILLSEGEQSHSMYLLLEGQLIVTRKEGDKDVILGYINGGEVVGELSFLDQAPRSATVRALKECKLAQIPLKTIEEIFKTQPAWLEVFIKTLVGRIRKVDSRINI